MHDWNRRIIEEFRATGGNGVLHPYKDQLLLLTVKGARSGRPMTVPLVHHMDGGRYVVAATEMFRVRATPLPRGPERDRLYAEHSRQIPVFGDYPAKTKRIIPVVLLERIEGPTATGRG